MRVPVAAGRAKHLLLQRAVPDVVLTHGKGDALRVALTFDDGPWPGQTDDVLRLLSERGARATFFMLGSSVRRDRALAKRVADFGMLVGNHGESHRDLRTLRPEEMRAEITGGAALIEEATGTFPRWFRPPYGKLPLPALAMLPGLGMRAALWSVDSGDCLYPPAESVTALVVSSVRPGSVVLLHDGGEGRDGLVRALPPILDTLAARGYAFVTLDDLG